MEKDSVVKVIKRDQYQKSHGVKLGMLGSVRQIQTFNRVSEDIPNSFVLVKLDELEDPILFYPDELEEVK